LRQQLHGEALECSTGVAAYPEHGKSGAELLRSVDAALYRAKAVGGSHQAAAG
jgi:GGDEF domain-containing protein